MGITYRKISSAVLRGMTDLLAATAASRGALMASAALSGLIQALVSVAAESTRFFPLRVRRCRGLFSRVSCCMTS